MMFAFLYLITPTFSSVCLAYLSQHSASLVNSTCLPATFEREVTNLGGTSDDWHDASSHFANEAQADDASRDMDSGYESAIDEPLKDTLDPSLPEDDTEDDCWHESAIDDVADEFIERSPEAPDGIRYFRKFLHREEVPRNVYYSVWQARTDQNLPGGRGKHPYNLFHLDPQRDNSYWHEQRKKQGKRRPIRIKEGVPLPPVLDFSFSHKQSDGESISDESDRSNDDDQDHEHNEIVRLATKKQDITSKKEIKRDRVRAKIMKYLLNIEKEGAFVKDQFEDVCYHPDMSLDEVKRRYREGLLPRLKVKNGAYLFEKPTRRVKDVEEERGFCNSL